jgi:hypothetical protein
MRWVTKVPSWSITYQLLCLNTDTHHTGSFRQRYRCWRGTAPGSCIKKQCGEWQKFPRSQSHINYYVSTQTLTTLGLRCNGIGGEGTQNLADALKINAVSGKSSLLINRMSTIMFQHRHSPHWIFVWTISVLKRCNIWWMSDIVCWREFVLNSDRWIGCQYQMVLHFYFRIGLIIAYVILESILYFFGHSFYNKYIKR